MKEVGKMKICNECNSEMESGYVQSRDGVYWDSKVRRVAVLAGINSSAIKLSGDAEGVFSGSAAKAYLCEKCRKVVIYY